MKRPDLSTVAIVLVLLALLVPTSAAPGDHVDGSGLVVVPSNGANGAYASLDESGQLVISLDGSAIDAAGQGANPNAQTEFRDVFAIKSESSDGMAVWTDDSSTEVIFRIEGSNRPIEGPADCTYLAPGDTRTVGVSVTSGARTGRILKTIKIRARQAVPADCPEDNTQTPTPPSTPAPGGGGGEGESAPATPSQPPETPPSESGAPSAAFDITPPSEFVCGPVRFDAREAGANESSIGSYEWSFPDRTASGPSVRHTFAAAGRANVSLTVEDEAGRRDTVTRTFAVNDQPAVQLIVPESATPGEPVRLVANVTDRYGELRGIYWRFQDGSTKAGASVTHTFKPGSRSVEVRALDSCGAEGVTTATIELSPRGPVETAVDAVSSGIPFAVRSAAVVVLAPLLFALDRRRKGRRRRR
jgi:hypothetical protein